MVELEEGFLVTLSNPSGATVISTATATGTVGNDDSATVTINDVTQVEGDSGTTDFVFSATLSQPADVPITLDFFTSDDTATVADNDYIATSGSITIPAGSLASESFTVVVNGDSLNEADERFLANLTNLGASGRNVTFLDGQDPHQAVGEILNDDTPTLDIAATNAAQAEGDNGATAFTFTVTRSGDLSGVSDVNWEVSPASGRWYPVRTLLAVSCPPALFPSLMVNPQRLSLF